jgi:hypothetical protein
MQAARTPFAFSILARGCGSIIDRPATARCSQRVRCSTRPPAPKCSLNLPWVLAVVATPTEIEGLSELSHPRLVLE